MARRRITGGKVTEERDTPGGEDERRTRERDGQIDGGRDPHSTPSLPTRTLLYALRDPRGGETSRLPPSSYVFSVLALSPSSPFYSTYLFLAPSRSYLPRTPAPNLPFLAARLSLRFSSSPSSLPNPLPARRRRCISALTSANSRRPARKRRRQTRFHSAPMKWRTTERSPPWRTSSETSSRTHVGLSPVGDFPAGRIPTLLTLLTFRHYCTPGSSCKLIVRQKICG